MSGNFRATAPPLYADTRPVRESTRKPLPTEMLLDDRSRASLGSALRQALVSTSPREKRKTEAWRELYRLLAHWSKVR